MRGCTEDMVVCSVCGCMVSYQDFEGETRLMHFSGHQLMESGEVVSVWQLHLREVCLRTRKLHWQALLNTGIQDTLVPFC